MTVEEFLNRFDHVEQHPGGWKVSCPTHEDGSPSLGVSEGEGGEILLQCYAGCPTPAIVASMGLEMRDLFPGGGGKGQPDVIYQYVDEAGHPLYEALRYNNPKSFKQRHLDPETGEYVYNLEGVRRVLFRLPQVIEAASKHETIYLCEGEKDVLSIVAAGGNATCNPMGAGKWRKEYNDFLIGANVIVVADRDEAGTRHATRVRDSLRQAGVLVMVVEAREGKDATDHLEAGYGLDEFAPVVERVRRGIVTAKEMAQNAYVHEKALEGSISEWVIPDFSLGRTSVAFRPGRVYLVGGYTGDGKTTWSLQCTRTLCSLPVPPRVGYFTLEMSSDDLRNRFIEHYGIPLHHIEHPWLLTEQEKVLYRAAVGQLAEWPLEVMYDSGIDADAICATTHDREYDIVFVDHIHQFNWGTDRRTLEREIVQLTNLALDFNIPVVILAQLRKFTRGKDFATYPKPTLQDFRETGTLAEVASQAFAIWRHRIQGDAAYDPAGFSSLVMLKNRYGPTAETTLRLDTKRMIFVPGGYTHESAAAGTTDPGLLDGAGSSPDAY